jgi:hypothetical protein
MKTSKFVAIMTCALTSVAVAEGYVVGGFSGNTAGATGASWSTLTNVTIQSSKYVLDNDSSAPLTLSPSVTNAANVVIESVVKFVASESLTDLPIGGAVADAQAGLAVLKTNESLYAYYGFVTNAGAWVALSGATPDLANDVTVRIEIDGVADKVKFFVGGVALSPELTIPDFASVKGISCFGNGSLTSINAKYKYETAAGAIAAASAAGVDQSTIMADGAVQNAANGMPMWKCEAVGLSTTDAAAALNPVPVALDTDTKMITLAMTNSPADGLTVTYQVKANGENSGSPCAHDNIKIPLATGKYTLEPIIAVTAP